MTSASATTRPRTIEAYVAAVVKLTRYFRTPPDQLSPEQVRQFQLHLVQQRVSFSLLNQVTAGLRFFYGITLGRPDVVHRIAYGKRPKKLPDHPGRPTRSGASSTPPPTTATAPCSAPTTPWACASASWSACAWRTSTPPGES